MNPGEMSQLLRELGVTTVLTSPLGQTRALRWEDERGEVIEDIYLEFSGLRLGSRCQLEPDPTLWDVLPVPTEEPGEEIQRQISPKSGLERAAVRQLLRLSGGTEDRPTLPKFMFVRGSREYVFLEDLAECARQGYRVVNYRSHTRKNIDGHDFTTWEALLEWQGPDPQ